MFETPASLGTLVFGGGSLAAGGISPALVIGYSALHFVAFALLRLVLAWLMCASYARPAVLL